MKKYIAEGIGTFALLLCGTGSIIVDQSSNGAVGLVGIALAFGFIVMAMIYVFGNTSGTHINPAVTIALALSGRMSKREVPGYILAQTIGAILASGSLHLMFPTNELLGGTYPSGSEMQSFIMEFILTFFLMITIMGVTSSEKDSSLVGIVIGLALIGLIFVGGPISGGSYNPARSLAPAVFSGNYTSLWIYMIAPVLGAICAVFTWDGLKSE